MNTKSYKNVYNSFIIQQIHCSKDFTCFLIISFTIFVSFEFEIFNWNIKATIIAVSNETVDVISVLIKLLYWQRFKKVNAAIGLLVQALRSVTPSECSVKSLSVSAQYWVSSRFLIRAVLCTLNINLKTEQSITFF